jgi:hypothetical protein
LAYEDWAFKLGAGISLATLVLIAVGWHRLGRRIDGNAPGEVEGLAESPTGMPD